MVGYGTGHHTHCHSPTHVYSTLPRDPHRSKHACSLLDLPLGHNHTYPPTLQDNRARTDSTTPLLPYLFLPHTGLDCTPGH